VYFASDARLPVASCSASLLAAHSSGTPTFTLNGIPDLPPFETFEDTAPYEDDAGNRWNPATGENSVPSTGGGNLGD